MNQIFLGIYMKDVISLTRLINTFSSVILLIETSQSEILALLQTPIKDGTLSLWLPINASLIAHFKDNGFFWWWTLFSAVNLICWS